LTEKNKFLDKQSGLLRTGFGKKMLITGSILMVLLSIQLWLYSQLPGPFFSGGTRNLGRVCSTYRCYPPFVKFKDVVSKNDDGSFRATSTRVADTHVFNILRFHLHGIKDSGTFRWPHTLRPLTEPQHKELVADCGCD